jgi:hypothetical protein
MEPGGCFAASVGAKLGPMIRWVEVGSFLVAIAAAASCSGSRAAIDGAPASDGAVRSRALTVEEAAQILNTRGPELSRCYAYERLNVSLPDGADFVAQVFIPNDGSEPVVEMVAASVPDLTTLEDCLLRTLRKTQFPAHSGPPLTINVPIKAPR